MAFTYNDPVIFYEYAIDVAEACHAAGVKTVAVTAGYMSPKPRAEFFRHIDAANVDLKAFTEDFYFKLTKSHLAPVLETLEYLKHETDVWFEITTLLIPGENDSAAEVAALSRWVVEKLGPDVPVHFSAFHPDFRMLDKPATPHATLAMARAHRHGRGRPLRLRRQRPRPRPRDHLLSPVRRAADRARLVHAGTLGDGRRGALQGLRDESGRGVRGPAGDVGRQAAAGEAGGV